MKKEKPISAIRLVMRKAEFKKVISYFKFKMQHDNIQSFN
jgi:hypothetical protein